MVTDESLGSDESLGGALLTPIPWLRNHDLEAVQAEMIAEGNYRQHVLPVEIVVC